MQNEKSSAGNIDKSMGEIQIAGVSCNKIEINYSKERERNQSVEGESGQCRDKTIMNILSHFFTYSVSAASGAGIMFFGILNMVDVSFKFTESELKEFSFAFDTDGSIFYIAFGLALIVWGRYVKKFSLRNTMKEYNVSRN
ncbi:MAG: hypothetical protein ACYDEE_00170 [Ignavibacteriaceae bacterium]